MRTIERTVYTVQELQEHHPSGFARALEEFCQHEMQWADWSDEQASLKALDEHVGWNRGYRGYWWADQNKHDEWDLSGKRAWAWYENVVLGPLRVRWGYVAAPGPLGQERRQSARYGYRPGTVPPAPFTGYYMDDVLLEAIRDGLLRRAMTVGQVMAGLADEVERCIDRELESRCEADYFIEHAEANEYEFYENGEQA